MPEEQVVIEQPTKPAPKFGNFFAEKMGFNEPPADKPIEPSQPEKPVEQRAAKPILPTIGKPAQKLAEKPTQEAAPANEELTDEPPANLSPKAAESWKQFRQKANDKLKAASEYRSKFESAQKELDEIRKAPPTKIEVPPEFESIKAEREQLSAELKRTNLERHPEFKKHFEAKFGSAIDLAKDAVGKDNAEAVAKLLKMSDTESAIEKLEEMAGELSPLKAGQLANAITAYKLAAQEKEGLLSKAELELQAVESSTQQGQAKNQEQFQKRVQEVTGKALELASTLEAFSTKEGDEAHNEAIKTNQQFVKDFYAGKVSDELVQWTPALAAEALHLKAVTIPALQSELKKRDDIIASYTKGTPRIENGGGGGGQAGKKGFISTWKENAPQG